MNPSDYVGSICAIGQDYVSPHYAACDGTVIAIAENEALYSIIGTRFGGDGRVSVGLPDLRGRVPLGSGQGLGLTNRLTGQMGGREKVEVQITTNLMPAHTHTAEFAQADLNGSVQTTVDTTNAGLVGGLSCNISNGGGTSPANAYPGRSSNASITPWAAQLNEVMAGDVIASGDITRLNITTSFSGTNVPATVGSTGDGEPVTADTSLPAQPVYYVIATIGIYPERS